MNWKLILKLIKENFSLVITFIIIGIINLIFTYFPLVNILSYESSLINSVLFSLIFGFYFLFSSKQKISGTLPFFLVLWFVPVVILTVSTIYCNHCPLDDGFYFYFILSIPSIIVGIAIAQFSKFISFKFRFLVFTVLWLIVLLGFLPELYFNPQIYFYNPIFGYFPGVIYDQTIEISSKLILYRLINSIISIIVIYFTFTIKHKSKTKRLTATLIIVFSYLIFSQNKSYFGFSSDLSTIKTELKSTLETEHFTIICSDSLSEREKKILILNHEFYYSEISELLNSTPEQKIVSIIFETGAQKKELFGSANADVAKPWLYQIYLNYDNYDESLKHEIAHIFSSDFAENIFKIPSNFNPGLIEGFAMAVENNYDDYDIDYLAAIAYQNEYLINFNQLFGSFSFFSNASSISYIYAGSLLKYLAEKYGWEQIKNLYRNGNFEEVFSISIDDIEKKYIEYLKTFRVGKNLNKANYYFGRIPLVKKFCARATAKELNTANELFSNKEFEKAANIYSKIYNYSGAYSALVGHALSLKESGLIDSSITVLNESLSNFKGSAYYYYLELLLADLYSLQKDFLHSSKIYNELVIQNPHERYLRTAMNRLEFLEKSDSILYVYLTERESRLALISELFTSQPADNLLQSMVELAIESNSDYLDTLNHIKIITNKHEFSAYSYFMLSKYAFLNLNFIYAELFAEMALNNAPESRYIPFHEHFRKIIWAKQNYNKYFESK